MKLIKQHEKLAVTNKDIGETTEKKQKNGPLLPDSIRALICGPSGVGKTNLMLCLLTDMNGLKFENIYIYSKSISQPKCYITKRSKE
jgi:DNA polymerase III delta prime subunit